MRAVVRRTTTQTTDRPCPLCGWSARWGDHGCPGRPHPGAADYLAGLPSGTVDDLHPAVAAAWFAHRRHPSAITRRALANAISLACSDPRCARCDSPYPLAHPLQRYCDECVRTQRIA